MRPPLALHSTLRTDTAMKMPTQASPRRARSMRALQTALAIGLLAGSAAASAATLVDESVAAPSASGSNSVDAYDWMAENFVLGAAATLDSIAVQLFDAAPESDAGQSFVLALYNNVGGLPGLDFNGVDQGRLFSTSVTYTADGWSGASGLGWQLGAGTYWLAVEASADPSSVSFLQLPTGATPASTGVAFYSGADSYAALDASNAFGLRIDSVAAVPEPSSLALMLGGLGAVGWAGRRNATRRRS